MDAKEILRETINLEKYKFVDHLQGSTLDAVLEAMEEYTQSLQNKVKELEAIIESDKAVFLKVCDYNSELESSLTESKAREERLREGIKKGVCDLRKIDFISSDCQQIRLNLNYLLSSNQPDKKWIL